MLSDVEKKAVFYLEDLENDKEHLVIEQRQAVHIVLELISKLQKENEKQDKVIDKMAEQLQNIREEFLQYDWKNSNPKQIYNQLKSLYESIYRKE